MSETIKQLTLTLIAHNEKLMGDCFNVLSCDECGVDAQEGTPMHLTRNGSYGALFVYCPDCYEKRETYDE